MSCFLSYPRVSSGKGLLLHECVTLLQGKVSLAGLLLSCSYIRWASVGLPCPGAACFMCAAAWGAALPSLTDFVFWSCRSQWQRGN